MSALLEAATARHGVTLSAWEAELRAVVQARMERAVLALSEAAPSMLDDAGDKHHRLEVEIVLPAGDRLRFTASLELVE
jgi:hypothetical protein